MKNQWLILSQLDRKLSDYQKLGQNDRPKLGWIKTIRQALGMTAEQFANRLKVHRARVVQLERAEINDAVTLRTLKKAAAALNCKVVYAIVPIGSTSDKPLEAILENEAESVATEQIKRVAHSMSLEAQSVSSKVQAEQKNKLIKKLLQNPRKKIWGRK